MWAQCTTWLIKTVAHISTYFDQEMLPQQQQKIIKPNRTVKRSNHRNTGSAFHQN